MAHPDRTRTPEQDRGLIFLAAGICGGIASAFAIVGAWPVIPFAGLEVAALWVALNHLRRHADDEERLELTERQIIVRRRSSGRDERHEFIRHWVRLRVERVPGRSNCRLFLRSHGREVEIGRLLNDKQKQELAGELREKLGTA